MPDPSDEARLSATHVIGDELLEERIDRSDAIHRARIRFKSGVTVNDRQDATVRVVTCAQTRQRFLSRQHQELGLGHIVRWR